MCDNFVTRCAATCVTGVSAATCAVVSLLCLGCVVGEQGHQVVAEPAVSFNRLSLAFRSACVPLHCGIIAVR